MWPYGILSPLWRPENTQFVDCLVWIQGEAKQGGSQKWSWVGNGPKKMPGALMFPPGSSASWESVHPLLWLTFRKQPHISLATPVLQWPQFSK